VYKTILRFYFSLPAQCLNKIFQDCPNQCKPAAPVAGNIQR